MRWWNRFGASLLFAAFAAGLYPIYASLGELLLGSKLAFAAYVLTSAAIYLLGIANKPAHGLAAGFAIFASGALLLLAGASGSQLVLLTALLIGVFRSGLLLTGEGPGSRSSGGGFGRRFAREVGFIGAGLVLAAHFSDGGVFPEAFALWGFYLAQSGFFLLGGRAAHDRGEGNSSVHPDIFEMAIKRAREVLAASPG